MYRIAIYTAIFGGKDVLYDPLNYKEDELIDYYCFTDDRSVHSDAYQVVIKDAGFVDMAMSARFYKICGFEELQNYDYVIWHDGNIQVDHSKIGELVSHSSGNFMTTFKHPHRNCFYEEAVVCIRRNKEKPLKILKQVLCYYYFGLPSGSGLFETGIVVKNISFCGSEFYEQWWTHVFNYSVRDQLSLCFLVWCEGIRVGVLPGSGTKNDFSIYHAHFKKAFPSKNYFKLLLVKLILLIKPNR